MVCFYGKISNKSMLWPHEADRHDSGSVIRHYGVTVKYTRNIISTAWMDGRCILKLFYSAFICFGAGIAFVQLAFVQRKCRN